MIAIILVACSSGDPASSGNDGPLVETGRAVTGTVGVEGGSLRATSSTGITYTLDVPAGALAQATQITLTPIRGLDGGPLSDGFVGAVQFGPSGLRFRIPAVLRIGATATAGGRTLVGFGSRNDGTAPGLDLAKSSGGTILLDVAHFSNAGASAATPDDLAHVTPADDVDPAEAAGDALARIVGSGTSADQIAGILRRWYVDAVHPGLQAADGGGAAAEGAALGEWVLWRVKRQTAAEISLIPVASIDALLATEDAEARPLVARAFHAEIDGSNADCVAQHDLAPLAAASGTQQVADHFGLGTADLGLDRHSFLRDACVTPEIESVAIPAPLQAGFPNSMDAQARMRFGNAGEPVGGPFAFSLTAVNATLGTPQGFSTADGRYTSVITAATQGAVSVSVGACVVLPGPLVAGSDLCASQEKLVQGVDLTGTWSGSYSQTIRDEAGNTAPGGGTLTLQIRQNQNAISGTYQNDVSTNLSFPGQVFATLSGVDLLNFQLVQSGQCPGSFTGPATINATGTVITAQFTGTSCAGTHSNGLATITRVP